ncbi:MAG: hypothetical protein K2J72_08520 [Oscillospiraceae bacterium]|nr:hypothetical protein [Oscillospiraceae bacterium]
MLACLIPKRIMWEQSYSSLLSDYRSYDFGIAVQGIVEFFAVDCKSNVKNIKREYERRFREDIKEIREKSPELCLHYQRRLLAQFYYQLDLCARSPFIGKRRVRRDFTSREADIVRLLYLMGSAVNESDILFKDISCDERVPRSARGLSRPLVDIYRVLKESKPYMEL